MRLLALHPEMEVTTLTASEKNAGKNFEDCFPQMATYKKLPKLIKARAMSATISLFLQRCIPLYSAQPANSPAVFLTVYLG